MQALSYDGVAHARLVQGGRAPTPSPGQAEQEVLGSDERVLEGRASSWAMTRTLRALSVKRSNMPPMYCPCQDTVE